ncbi:MAG: HAD family hydrolase [Gammaproteobacteria bacterium]|nr:HAD family hydrolase [Gammaproteobacteria bacterium]
MKAIIFDIDGTLIESMSVDTELYFSSISEVLGPVNIRDKLSDYDHVSDSGILAQLLDDNGYTFDDEVAATIQAVFVEGIRRHIMAAGPFPIIDGAVQFVENTRKSDDRRVAIATGGWRKSALLKLESAGFNIHDIPLVTSDDSHSRVEIMRSALAKIGDDFESVTYFGDAEWDQRACHSLGWNFVAVGPELSGIESYVGVNP